MFMKNNHIKFNKIIKNIEQEIAAVAQSRIHLLHYELHVIYDLLCTLFFF